MKKWFLFTGLMVFVPNLEATTCIVDFVPTKKTNFIQRLNPLAKHKERKEFSAFLVEAAQKSSCYRASLIATECPTGRDSTDLPVYQAALAACDKEVEESVNKKYSDPARQEDELGTLMAARTACNETHDHEIDLLMCKIDQTYGQIRTLNPHSESVKDSKKH